MRGLLFALCFWVAGYMIWCNYPFTEKIYYKNGNLNEIAIYKKGRREGITKKFDKNGKLWTETLYVQGIKVSSVIYDEDGFRWIEHPVAGQKIMYDHLGRVVLQTQKNMQVEYFDYRNRADTDEYQALIEQVKQSPRGQAIRKMEHDSAGSYEPYYLKSEMPVGPQSNSVYPGQN